MVPPCTQHSSPYSCTRGVRVCVCVRLHVRARIRLFVWFWVCVGGYSVPPCIHRVVHEVYVCVRRCTSVHVRIRRSSCVFASGTPTHTYVGVCVCIYVVHVGIRLFVWSLELYMYPGSDTRAGNSPMGFGFKPGCPYKHRLSVLSACARPSPK